MGAQGHQLRESLEMRVRAESGATLMINSASPVKLLPSGDDSPEYGIGIHASVENEALLCITPEAHVPHLDAQAGLWTRYDLSPRASLVSVQLADLTAQAQRPPRIGGRYTSRTRVHHATPAEGGPTADVHPVGRTDPAVRFRADDSLPHVASTCSLPSVSSCGLSFSADPSWSCDWTYGRRFKGLVMGTPTTNVIASVILYGTRASAVIRRFRGIDTQETGKSVHKTLGLHGDAHLAIQDIADSHRLLVVARIGTEHREDMHRLLHHCLKPLERELGLQPYERKLPGSTPQVKDLRAASLFAPPRFTDELRDFAFDLSDSDSEPSLHVQHRQIRFS